MYTRWFNCTASFIAFAILLCVLASCMAVVDPYVEPKDDLFRETKSLTNAVKYAEDTRGVYYQAIREHTGFNRAVGSTLIGSTAAALVLGITNGSSDAITGLGVGGAGLYSLRNWLHGRPKLLAYQAGIDALTCTLTVFGPVRAIDSTGFDRDLDMKMTTLRNALPDLKTKLDIAKKKRGDESPDVVRAGIIFSNAEAALEKGGTVKTLRKRAAVTLYDAVHLIRSKVTKALTESEPDVASLVATLSKTIPIQAGLITGQPLDAPGELTTKLSDHILNPLRDAADAVKEQTAVIEQMLIGLDTGPDSEQIEACSQIDATSAGLTFRVDPASSVHISAATPDRLTKIYLSGGVPPYSARWIGQTPGVDVSLQPVNHDYGSADDAEVEITVTAQAKRETYTLSLKDSGRGRATLLVHIEPKFEPKESNEVSQVQQRLVDMGCLAQTRKDGKTNIDGDFGRRTRAAIAAFSKVNEDNKEAIEALGKESHPTYLERLKEILNNVSTTGCEAASSAPPPATAEESG